MLIFKKSKGGGSNDYWQEQEQKQHEICTYMKRILKYIELQIRLPQLGQEDDFLHSLNFAHSKSPIEV